MENIQLKTCSRCKQSKTLDYFNSNKSKKDKKCIYCKECVKIDTLNRRDKKKVYDKLRAKTRTDEDKQKRRDWANNNYLRKKLTNPEKHKEELFKKKLYRDKNKAQYIYTATRRKAKSENIPFNLEISDIIIPEYCPILEIKLEIFESKDNLNGPSIDKIIPNLGYIKGNIRIISRKANMMKLNASPEELKLFSINILKYIKEYEQNK